MRNLGLALLGELTAQHAPIHFLMTHFHWDHIQGIPFFVPLYNPANEIVFHSPRPSGDIREILEGQMTYPYFPVRFEQLAARREFALIPAEGMQQGKLTIRPFPMNHPQGASGYRLELDGAVIVHASDCEHGDAELDKVLREYARDADVLIYDAQYTPQEYEVKKAWGHSTWLEGVRVARDANAKRLVLFHHDPAHNDEFLTNLVAEARSEFENTDAAKEGWSIKL